MSDGLSDLELREQIGEGGMSSVWKAWDAANNRTVAVQILDRQQTGDGDEIAHFREEARILADLDSPGIVRAYGYNETDDFCYLVMEYVDGYTFASLLRRKQHVRESDCLLICESVASALSQAWNGHGIVHCDLKPENIMINTDGIVKLTDLGIAHRHDPTVTKLDAPDHVFGTPAYISPEQVYGDVELDCRSDIYSLAATLYHLSTGRLLFPGLDNDNAMRAHCSTTSQARDPRTYRPALSIGFAQLLEAMLVKNRDYRLATWEDVYQMCRDVESGVLFKVRPTEGAPSSIKLL